MRWCGWILAGLALVFVLLARQQGQRGLAAERRAVEARIAERQAEADALVTLAAEGIPARRERLTAEQRKSAELEQHLAGIEQQRAALEQTVRDLTAAAESLDKSQAEAEDQRGADEDQLRDLHARIAQTEAQIAGLRKVLPRVADKSVRSTP